MNKIYLDPIAKGEALIDGIKKQSVQLSDKGLSTDTIRLAEACRLLHEAATKQDYMEMELKVAREEAHKRLEELKNLYTECKMPIKQSFAPELWHLFGIPDKK